jgi:dolichol-phosphate mannosyltransferase
MKRIVITGATGFIGANLAHRLVRDGHQVHALLRSSYRDWRIRDLVDDMGRHVVNLADEAEVTGAIGAIRPDWIFHLAVHGAYAAQTDLHQMVATNVTGAINVIRAGLRAGAETIVSTGSSSEYGVKSSPPGEQTWLDPNSHYAITKAAATHFARYTSIAEAANIVTLRLYSVYGPYEEPKRLMPTLVAYARRGRLPSLADARVARDFVFVDDVVDAYLRVAASPVQGYGQVFNVASGIQSTLADVVACARDLFGVAADPRWGSMPDRAWDAETWVGDPTAIAQTFEWRATTSLRDGLSALNDWIEVSPLRDRYHAVVTADGG